MPTRLKIDRLAKHVATVLAPQVYETVSYSGQLSCRYVLRD